MMRLFAVIVLFTEGWCWLSGRSKGTTAYPLTTRQWVKHTPIMNPSSPSSLNMGVTASTNTVSYDTSVSLPAPLARIVDVDVVRNSFIYEVTLDRDLGVEFAWERDTVNKFGGTKECSQIGKVGPGFHSLTDIRRRVYE